MSDTTVICTTDICSSREFIENLLEFESKYPDVCDECNFVGTGVGAIYAFLLSAGLKPADLKRASDEGIFDIKQLYDQWCDNLADEHNKIIEDNTRQSCCSISIDRPAIRSEFKECSTAFLDLLYVSIMEFIRHVNSSLADWGLESQLLVTDSKRKHTHRYTTVLKNIQVDSNLRLLQSEELYGSCFGNHQVGNFVNSFLEIDRSNYCDLKLALIAMLSPKYEDIQLDQDHIYYGLSSLVPVKGDGNTLYHGKVSLDTIIDKCNIHKIYGKTKLYVVGSEYSCAKRFCGQEVNTSDTLDDVVEFLSDITRSFIVNKLDNVSPFMGQVIDLGESVIRQYLSKHQFKQFKRDGELEDGEHIDLSDIAREVIKTDQAQIIVRDAAQDSLKLEGVIMSILYESDDSNLLCYKVSV